MQEKDRLVPLNNSWTRSNRIRANIPFPVWLDEEKVQIDIGRAERNMRIGGISHLKIEGVNDRKNETSVIYSISGVGPDGSLTARGSMISSKTKSYELKNKASEKISLLQNKIWISTDIKVNMDQLQDEIMEHGGNLRRPEDWAAKLDKITRDGVLESGTKHLLTGHDKVRAAGALLFTGEYIFLDSANAGILDLITGSFNPQVPTTSELATNIILYSTIWYMVSNLISSIKGDEGYRFSLFPGYEIDRALLLQILGRTQKIIVPR